MDSRSLDNILNKLSEVKVAVIGDGCVDIYWEADMTVSKISREVPNYPLPIYEERFSLGAGANVVSNLKALGVKNIKYVTCMGDDWRSTIFKKLLNEIDVGCEYAVVSDEIVTPAYCKPIKNGISNVKYEDPRIDFANHKCQSENLEKILSAKLEEAVKDADILVVCDQFDFGCITDNIRNRICEIGKKMPVIVDSRDRADLYKNVTIKPNEVELCNYLNISLVDASNLDKMSEAAKQFVKISKSPVVVTLGENGSLWCDNDELVHVKAFPVGGEIDFVGAGDSFLAGLSAVYCLSISTDEKLEFASLVPAVTIKKIGVTGVATPTELKNALTSLA